jgi:hypothetical protein
LASQKGVPAEALDISAQSIAQSHWSSEHDAMGEKPMIERVEEVAEVCAIEEAKTPAAKVAG